MWGSQGWNQWALQPAMFNDVPHEQIDWAALAKQWIQMQRTEPKETGTSAPEVVPPAPVSAAPEYPEGNVIPCPPLIKPSGPVIIPEPYQGPPRSFETDTEPFAQKPLDNSCWSKSQWEASAVGDVDERMWPSPRIEPPANLLLGKETFDYGHMHDNPPLAMQSVDYNHVSEYSYKEEMGKFRHSNMYMMGNEMQMYPPENQYDQYWSQVNATSNTISPMFLKKRVGSAAQPEEDTLHIDAVKRKQLPAWIREGLEKMEQERIKKIEKERMAKEKAEQMSKTKLNQKELEVHKESGFVLPAKSKFESDSDSDGENSGKEKAQEKVSSLVPVEEIKTEEEKKQELVLKVRRILTEILLDVTNAEMLSVAQEVYRKAIIKARQLASSTSLSSIASGLRGLANYGTESEASENEGSNQEDSDEELYHRIREKKKLFVMREKKMLAEREEKAEAEKDKQESIKKNANKEIFSEETTANVEINTDKNCQAAKEINDSLSDSVPKVFSVFSTSNTIPFISENLNDSVSENLDPDRLSPNDNKNKHSNESRSRSSSSENSSTSSNSGSETEEKHKKRKYKKKRDKKDKTKKLSKRTKSPKKDKHGRRSKSKNSDESSYSYHRKDKHNRKKSHRSESSSSSSSITHRRKHKVDKDRSHSHDRRKRRRSDSSSSSRHYHSRSTSKSRSYASSQSGHDGQRHRSSHHKSRRSPSPWHSSRLPKKYRRSRSFSSESENSGKKLKTKSWNR